MGWTSPSNPIIFGEHIFSDFFRKASKKSQIQVSLKLMDLGRIFHALKLKMFKPYLCPQHYWDLFYWQFPGHQALNLKNWAGKSAVATHLYGNILLQNLVTLVYYHGWWFRSVFTIKTSAKSSWCMLLGYVCIYITLSIPFPWKRSAFFSRLRRAIPPWEWMIFWKILLSFNDASWDHGMWFSCSGRFWEVSSSCGIWSRSH